MELQNEKERIIEVSRRNCAVGVASLVLSALCAFLAIYRQNPLAAQPANAPVAEFASARAMEHLKQIARKPHPIGSAEHAAVRDYILKELAEAGLRAEIQQSLVLSRQRSGSYVAANVQNIIARITGAGGANNRNAVLLSCHYDSVPTSPGASDDGASVAAFLEVIRALKASSPLKNDVLFLFTDGEEIGMLGAKAFMDEHPYAKDVAVALNFEARGIGGPSIMFETSEGNEWLIREMAGVIRRPIANSLTSDLYRLLPNATDLGVFKAGGLRGLNFAYISGLPYYHTVRDSYENIDERSLQHHGSSALALARRFGNLDHWPAPTINAVYFDIFSTTLVFYTGQLVRPLMAIGLILFVGFVILGLRMKRLTVRGIAFGVIGVVLNMLCVGALLLLIWLAVQSAGSNRMGAYSHSRLYAAGFLSLTVAVASALLIWFRRKTMMENLIAGALLVWTALMVLACLYLPGASYLFTWPLLLMLLALGALFIIREPMTSTKGISLSTAPTLVGVVLLAPVFNLVIAGFGMDAGWLVMILVTLLLALHYAQLGLLMTFKQWRITLVTGLLGICLVGTAILKTETGAKQPRRDHVLYALNVDTGKAIWGSADRGPDEWTAQFFSSGFEKASLADYVPWGSGTFLKGDAPALLLTAPSVVKLDDRMEGGLRALRLRIASTRAAPALTLYWKQELELMGLAVNGKRVVEGNFRAAKNTDIYRRFSYIGLPAEGIELSLEIKSSAPIEFKVEDWSYGLPSIPSKSYQARPDYIFAAPFLYSDCTVVMSSVKF